MKKKCYSVILCLNKQFSNEIFADVCMASSENDAITQSLHHEFVLNLLSNGYAISSKYAVALHETLAPINSESDCIVIREFDGSLRSLHIDLRSEYLDSFKRDLQALMSKHFSGIDPIYPEFKS